MGPNAPRHWALMLPPQPDDDEDRKLVTRRHELFVGDLKRYGLTVLTMENAAQLVQLLERLEAHVARRSVLVSGSYPSEQNDDLGRKVRDVSRRLGNLLAARQLQLVNGFGSTVGGETISGFLESAYADVKSPVPRMILRPFPQGESEAFQEQYRRDMVGLAGVVVVVAGDRNGAVAPGVLAEVTIARERDRPIVPIGATGGAAALLWSEMRDAGAPYDAASFGTIGEESATPDAIASALDDILTEITA